MENNCKTPYHKGNVLINGQTKELKIIDPGASSAFPFVESKDRDYFNFLLGDVFLTQEDLMKLNIKDIDILSYEEIYHALNKYINPNSENENTLKINTEKKFDEFHIWAAAIQASPNDEFDRFFCCILPETAGEDLIDFTPQKPEWNQYSPIETYFRVLEIFPYAQTFADLEHLEYANTYGNKLILFKDGTLFIHIKIGRTLVDDVQLHNGIEKRPIWYTQWLFPDNSRYHSDGHAKFGLPIDAIRSGNFEDILKAICFVFNPDCKISLVSRPTVKFQALFMIPKMLVGTQKIARYLVFENRFPSFREYIGTKNDLEIRKSFRFPEISEVVESFKKGVDAYFRNRSDIGYG